MKASLKFVSLAALTAATMALPAAAADMQDGQGKCQAKPGMAKCAGKCGPKMKAKAKCGAMKCAPKCSPKCAPKCAPKN